MGLKSADGATNRQARAISSAVLKRVAGMLWVAAWMPILGNAAEIFSEFPDTIHAGERYVIYSHGLIVEGEDPKPRHPQFGIYDFPAIKQALFEGGSFNLIAQHRPKNTQISAYVEGLAAWIRRLVSAGVKPSRITLIGFSRGGQITALTASRLASLGLNTAILGACTKGDIPHDPPLVLGGQVLSIYETSDQFGSCAKLAQRSSLESFEELAIATGERHGAFFEPRPEWLTPLKAWIARTNR